MIKEVIFSLSVIVIGFLLNLSIQSRYESIKSTYQDVKDKSSFENTSIRVYGNSGIEWYVKGNVLEIEKDMVTLDNPVFVSNNKGERITAKKAVLNKTTGLGKLEGDVNLQAKDIYMQADVANVDLKNNLVSGEGYVYVKEGDKAIRGRDYTIYLRPQKVIINNVNTEIK